MTEGATPGRPKKRFRPTFWASLWTLVTLAVLLSLGTWQLQRLTWKEDLIADVKARTAGPPIALPQDLNDPELAFQLVGVTGHFLPDKELRLANRTYEGRVGAHIVAPFVLSDGRGLLVDRGWVPPERYNPDSRAETAPPEGPQRLHGYLRQGGWGGMAMFRPDNEPAKGLFNWPDLKAMAAAASLPQAVDQFYLVLAPAPGGGARYPLPPPPPVDLPNNHLQYAITWYALALVLLTIFIIYHWRPADAA